jgi:hypothetical protein
MAMRISAALLTVMLLASAASADNSFIGRYEFDLSELNLNVWDASGSHDLSDIGLGGNVTFDIAQDSRGKIYGTAHANVVGAGLNLNFNYIITGSMTGNGSITRLKMKMKVAISGSVEGHPIRGSATIDIKAEVDEQQCTMLGSLKFRITIRGFGSESGSASFDMDFAPEMTGEVNAEADVTGERKNRFSGTGQIIMSNGETFGFTVSGVYNAKKDQMTTTFKATTASRGSSLKMVIDGGDNGILKVNGRVMGQRLRY